MKNTVLFLIIVLSLNAYSQLSFISHTIQNTTSDGARDLFLIDLDNDSLEDVIYCSESEGKLFWFKNMGLGNFGLKQLITDSALGVISVYAIDLDGDGYNDVLSASQWDNKIAWYKNLGGGNFSSQNVISDYTYAAISVYAADLDNDADYDIITASGSSDIIGWHENDGYGNFSYRYQVYEYAYGVKGTLAAKINNDDYYDIISPITNSNKVSWFKNDGAGWFFNSEHIITPSLQQPTAIFVEDINNDGDNDVFVSSFNANKIVCFENDGDGNFGSEQIISTQVNNPNSIFVVDLDNDSIVDLLSLSADNKLAYFPGTGSSSFGNPEIISESGNGAYKIQATDIDNDGDIDVIASYYFNSGIVWFENTLININNIEICEGESIEINGNWFSTDTTLTDSLQNYHGGDSIILTVLEVYPLPIVLIDSFETDSVLLDSGTIALPNALPAGGTFSGVGVSDTVFNPSLSGTGDFWITYTYTDTLTGCSNSDSTKITVYDISEIENIETDEFQIFPNPSIGEFTISGKEIQYIEIWNIAGEKIITVDCRQESGHSDNVFKSNPNFYKIDLNTNKKGIYFVKIHSLKSSKIHKLVLF